MAGSPQGSDLELAHEARHREGQSSSELGHSPLAGSEVGAVTPIQRANGPASAATDPDHDPNNPCKENAVSGQQHTSAPAVPAMPDFKEAFDGLEDMISRVQLYGLTLHRLAWDYMDTDQSDHQGSFYRVDDEACEIIKFLAGEAKKTADALQTAWTETHNARCDAEVAAFRDGRVA